MKTQRHEQKYYYSPSAWHWNIFVLPSATMEPEADGGVMKRGAWSLFESIDPVNKKDAI